MQEFQRILVGIDLAARGGALTPGSRKALEQALWLARQTGGSLALLHSRWSESRGEDAEPPGPEARAALEQVAADVRAEGVECVLELTARRPWMELARHVDRGDADIVVVGKRDNEEAETRRLGHVATKLLRKCPHAVWAVKPQHDLSLKLVLAATDLTPVGDRAERLGAAIASAHSGALHVVHGYQVPAELQAASSELSEEDFGKRVEALRTSAQEHMRAALDGAVLREEPVLHVGRGTGFSAIKEAHAHLHPDLLVLGSISSGGTPGLLVGTTAERILGRVDCSILALKPPDFVCPLTA